ncbi:hypothetical protein LJ737_09890 [Hymenobacter sp. 15J16-1T3B]|uniref:hypothetical protein n=1 Tax=Hymenobacter sp. 15J16-1T3B TaxID=2886941 RepID=UPI001D12EB07|nr:hypothetical protein [Hymenobacter sp. 15J16-1T3B]MCC3157551.1 hypothetical protein [Hymenobacter sp. 15J16-1T3B]
MKKLLPLTLALALGWTGAAFGQAPGAANGDLVSPGSNSWILHTPDNDGRSTLYLAPSSNGNGAAWDWNRQTQFRNTGNVQFSGKVGIGLDPDYIGTLSLAVEGTIGARGVHVRAFGAAWPDYVFLPTYRLRPLGEVAQFIALNHHLPDVPSAAEVEKNGIDVAAMDAVLLRKIEELTLHMIELQKQNEALQERLRKLEH